MTADVGSTRAPRRSWCLVYALVGVVAGLGGCMWCVCRPELIQAASPDGTITARVRRPSFATELTSAETSIELLVRRRGSSRWCLAYEWPDTNLTEVSMSPKSIVWQGDSSQFDCVFERSSMSSGPRPYVESFRIVNGPEIAVPAEPALQPSL